ncbi:hypothetical protein NKJ40_29200 [Mesorhizobium sp. M0119]|uniref:hypothetical protein n=1 Tax=Mesorhizobium sp. M0119 TaxID=2956885 RepID=UPI00333AE54F
MFILPERCPNVLFTEPIAKTHYVVIVPKGNAEGVHSYQGIRDEGLIFVTEPATMR